MPGFMSPRISSPAHPASGGATPGRGRGGPGMKRDREMIGQTVRIVQGPFKGNIIKFRKWMFVNVMPHLFRCDGHCLV